MDTKNFNKRVTTVLASSLFALVAGCSGGGGGGDSAVAPAPTPLADGGFTKTYARTPTLFGTFGFPEIKQQELYLASDIAGSGDLASIELVYHADVAAAVNCPDVSVSLGHTSLASLTTTFASNVNQGKGSQTVVVANRSLNIPAGSAGDTLSIPLDTPFNYNGMDNLVVEYVMLGACDATFPDQADGGGLAYNGALYSFSAANATGTTLAVKHNMNFVFAGGDNTVSYSVSGNSIPWNTSPIFNHAQMLYPASDINGSGPITGIALYSSNVSVADTVTITAKLAHTTLSALTTTFADNFDSGVPVTVMDAVTFNIPAGVPANEPIWLPLAGSFDYNGADNLIIDFEISGVDTNLFWWRGDVASHILYATPGELTGSLGVGPRMVALRFNGGTMDVLSSMSSSTANAFNAGAAGRMNLYRSSELGTGATINSVACRMNSATSTASTYDNYQVIMGHTDLDALDPTSANNFVSQHVAYDGALDIPAGLVQGDWITVNLTSPFVYDGQSNLVVWMGTTSASAAATTHSCYVGSFTDDHMGNAVPGAVTVTPQAFKFDMQLGITKY